MKSGDLLFVYGTLRLGQRADLSRKDGAIFLYEDRVNGELFNLGWYPGVNNVADSPDIEFNQDLPSVVGDVFLINDDGIVGILDLYEGHPDHFFRKTVKTEGKRTVWIYTYPRNVRDRDKIESGDWINRPCETEAA